MSRKVQGKVVEFLVSAVAFTGIAAVLLILVFVGKEAVAIFWSPEIAGEITWSKLFAAQVPKPGKPAAFIWQPVSSVPKVSMIPLFVGTLKVTLVGMLVATPLSVLAALFSAELAPRRLREWLKPIIELLAGIPSVVVGFFALMVLASFTQNVLGTPTRLNALVAGLGLSIAIAPVIFTVAEDALTAVPKSYREASLALGATRWETAFRVVLPAASPGVLAALLLGFGRAIGETMVVLMASGNAAILSASPTDSARTFSATIAAEMGEVVVGSAHWSVLFFIGVQLFIITFILNMIAALWGRRSLRRLRGESR